MALQGPISITFEQAFPHGCFLVGQVEQVKNFEASTNGKTVYAKDKATGEPIWQVPVMDGDTTLKAGQKTVAVKILSQTPPVAPPPVSGLPIAPVEFTGMTVTPYVNPAGRLAYSYRATGMRPARPKQQAAPSSRETAA
ncbi:plasmid replication, integration and excision activator [Nonomuraea sp. CA-141351]|uniref:plasmid replication, integration and excision activator n=1 Tax=Nonomuraea sp. CA-141351 TaxID=3239996 RepID=UPI003D93BE09